ncbi:hypothetical protein MNBD_GAMMA12-2711 [hydrothermal vent metagenome]|uniref:Uncharacterized protein n=1 Tax=hydrothermal vent metagenome TaxID=652676 RepID=A0A3B0YXB8_9ZZZZ
MYLCTKITNVVYFIDYEPSQEPETSDSDHYSNDWIKLVEQGLSIVSKQLPKLVKAAEHTCQDIRLKWNDEWLTLFECNLSQIDSEVLRGYIRACIASSVAVDQAIWSDDESNLGQHVVTWMACHTKRDIPLFIRYMECSDIDHIVGGDFVEVFDVYQWTFETMLMWVARLTSCRDQHIDKEGWDRKPYLSDWINANPSHMDLTIKVIAEKLNSMAWNEQDHEIDDLFNSIELEAEVFLVPEHGLKDIAVFIVKKAIAGAKELARQTSEQGSKPPHFLDKFAE